MGSLIRAIIRRDTSVFFYHHYFLYCISNLNYLSLIPPTCPREQLITCLQTEERERQWHYTQLELISQKIRSLPLTSSLSVSTQTVQSLRFQIHRLSAQLFPFQIVFSLNEVYQASKLGSIDQGDNDCGVRLSGYPVLPTKVTKHMTTLLLAMYIKILSPYWLQGFHSYLYSEQCT